MTDSEYFEKFLQPSLCNPFITMALGVTNELHRRGKEAATSNIFFHLLSDEVAVRISKYTSQQLAEAGHLRIESVDEWYIFIATKLLRSRFNLPSDTAF